jgi:hypothetical protein
MTKFSGISANKLEISKISKYRPEKIEQVAMSLHSDTCFFLSFCLEKLVRKM